MPETVLRSVREHQSRRFLSWSCSAAAGKEEEEDICSCLTFVLPDEVCALFQSWNSCLTVTSMYRSSSMMTSPCCFFSSRGFSQRHRLVLFTRKHVRPSLFYSHVDGSFLMPDPCSHTNQTDQRRVGSWKSLLESLSAAGNQSSRQLGGLVVEHRCFVLYCR